MLLAFFEYLIIGLILTPLDVPANVGQWVLEVSVVHLTLPHKFATFTLSRMAVELSCRRSLENVL